tara:strand:+ start:10971 stop:14534 length:3564 start_codon:yes stop_codon:yes gene_type:complete
MANELRHSDVGTALSKSEWEAVGGHIFNSQAAGDIMYASTTSQLSRLGIGSANQVLAVNSGATAPEWVSAVNLATNVTVSANNTTNETVYPVFVDGATGTQGAETDTGLTYNPSSGLLTATGFSGNLTGTLQTASQTNITAVGTISTGVWQGTAIASGYIAADAITGAKIADDAIDSEHYTDGSIDTAHIADNQVTLAKMAGLARGKIIYGDASGDPAALAVGSNGTYLTTDGTDISWGSIASAAVTALNNATANELVTVGSTTTELDAEANLTYASDVLTTTSSSASLPRIDITNTHAGATAGEIRFNKDSASGDDSDVMGTISWYGTDAGENTHQQLAYMDAIITDSAHGSEAASLRFYVAENDGTNTLGLQLAGQADDNGEIDVTIGAGAASTTTIAGTLTMGSTAAMTNAGLLSVANQSNITGVGTISSGTWEGTTIAVDQGGTGATSLTDGGILLGSGTSAVTAMSVLANGEIVVGDGTTDPVALAAFTGSTGTLKHERGGIEADISAIAKGGIIAGSGTGSMAIRTVGSNDQVLTADSSEATGVKWADASGGGTIQLTNQGAIPAGAPVSVDSNGRATVISGLGNDLYNLGGKHDDTAGTTDNPSGTNATGTEYTGYSFNIVDMGSTGIAHIVQNNGYNRIQVHIGTYSQTAGTTAGTREIQWGVETTLAVANSDRAVGCWNPDDSLLCIMYKDTGNSKLYLIQYPISNSTLGTASTALEIHNGAINNGAFEIEYDKNDNRYIVLFSPYGGGTSDNLMCGVYYNNSGTPAQTIAPSQVSGDVHSRYAQLKWANGASGKDDVGLIVYEDYDDSRYVKAVGVTHNNSDTITYTGTPVEIFGADKAYRLGDVPRGTPGNISFDTTAPPAAGGFATTDDVFVVACPGADGDGDIYPFVVPVAVDSSDCSIVAGTVETPYTVVPDYTKVTRSGASTFVNEADQSPMSDAEGNHMAICYDPDRDVHVLVWRMFHYYENFDWDGGIFQNGSALVSQTLTLNASNNATIDNTYNTSFHPILGDRQSTHNQGVNRTTSMGVGLLVYYGVGLSYSTHYDTMFMVGHRKITTDSDTEYEYDRHFVFAFNGQTTAQGGSAALTYAPSSVDRIIGFNTTAISDTGTGATATISLPGSENTNQTGLTTGKKYFIQDSGTLTVYRALFSRNFLIGGVATSASTKIMPKLAANGMQF